MRKREFQVNFTAEEIRQLRYRLGWSRAELARQLNLDLSVLGEWEAGRLPPDHFASLMGTHRSHLLRIFNLAESNAEKLQRRPIAEVIMRRNGLSQIHDLEILETMSTSENLK